MGKSTGGYITSLIPLVKILSKLIRISMISDRAKAHSYAWNTVSFECSNTGMPHASSPHFICLSTSDLQRWNQNIYIELL